MALCPRRSSVWSSLISTTWPLASKEPSHVVPRGRARGPGLLLPGLGRQVQTGVSGVGCAVSLLRCHPGRHSASTEGGRSRRVKVKARKHAFCVSPLAPGAVPGEYGELRLPRCDSAQQRPDEGDGSQWGMTRCHSHVGRGGNLLTAGQTWYRPQRACRWGLTCQCFCHRHPQCFRP